MRVVETFFSVDVGDMQRATRFYCDAFGATIIAALPFWTSLHIADVRIGLFLHPERTRGRIGLHFAVDDLEEAHAMIGRAGGRVVIEKQEVAPGVFGSEIEDTEGNLLSVRAR